MYHPISRAPPTWRPTPPTRGLLRRPPPPPGSAARPGVRPAASAPPPRSYRRLVVPLHGRSRRITSPLSRPHIVFAVPAVTYKAIVPPVWPYRPGKQPAMLNLCSSGLASQTSSGPGLVPLGCARVAEAHRAHEQAPGGRCAGVGISAPVVCRSGRPRPAPPAAVARPQHRPVARDRRSRCGGCGGRRAPGRSPWPGERLEPPAGAAASSGAR